MYTKFYGLKCKPFELLPDPRFLYASKNHDLALTHLEYGITDNKGFIVLTGDVGTGKTTLINFFLSKITTDVNTAFIFNTNIDPTTFLEMVANDFRLQTPDTRRSTLYDGLYQFLLDEHIHGRRSVLIIDEAQNMPQETLEEVRMLSNFETEESYLLQIIIVGQPQLRQRLNDPELAQLTQRISVYYHLAPLEKSDISRYIKHRLKVSGYPFPDLLFTSDAIEKIYEYTNGVPRLISSICDTALVYGYADELKTIDANIIKQVIKNRGIEPGIQYEEERVSRNVKALPGKEGTIDSSARIGKHIYSEISDIQQRLTSIEQRVGQLENIKTQQTISKLIEWLKETQKENQRLRKAYNSLVKSRLDNQGNSSISNKDSHHRDTEAGPRHLS
ncbi:MAG: AAA family ATPase [Deltaproteobacteria bacterium]|jgi:general secretion pathway protein A|nr:AAA family ATPase [Deltaproteobacteria bacterium]